MNSTIKYYRCHEMFQHLEMWKCVPEAERREVYEDVVFNLAKKEKEENKAMRKRNMKVCIIYIYLLGCNMQENIYVCIDLLYLTLHSFTFDSWIVLAWTTFASRSCQIYIVLCRKLYILVSLLQFFFSFLLHPI
ncbi:Pre-mRNA-processing factor 40 B [Portunus trituberculatus]|uniref:Pre-mRNA-processing factor 40 B n=1 Tax=Portunus trituberculatus TaxID=210409 RepID=A0A5B7IC95_PORTR|nr:Pre-mRNA-processing factor 40 B [Portunus trituberculatus]